MPNADTNQELELSQHLSW